MKYTVDYLKNNTVFWSRLGFAYDPPVFNKKGEYQLFDNRLCDRKYHRQFAKTGVHLHGLNLPSGWIGLNKFDYSSTDKVIKALLKSDPEAKLMAMVRLDPPVDWCRKYPEELFVYFEGPREKKSIKKLVGTLKQDYFGFESPNGYYSGSTEFNRSNVGGLIARQSFSSKIWLEDAEKALNNLMKHIDELFHGVVIGYHISYGTSGETLMWGAKSSHYGDYGECSKKGFYKFAESKYGNMQNAAKAWNIAKFDMNKNYLPSPDERYKADYDLNSFFRCGNTISKDYDEYLSFVNAENIEYFCKSVKNYNSDLLTGVFYGYFIHVCNCAYGGHSQLQKLLDSPYVDFFSSPMSYYRCRYGYSDVDISAIQSVNLYKLWFDEIDLRSFLAEDVKNDYSSDDLPAAVSVLAGKFAKNLSHGSGVWWTCSGDGRYDDKDILYYVNLMNKANTQIRKKQHSSVADILVLCDESSAAVTRISKNLTQGFSEDLQRNLTRCGSVYDMFRIRDIDKINLKQYKLIIFANVFEIKDDTYKYICDNSDNAVTFVFNYLSGAMENGVVSSERFQKITGFSYEKSEISYLDYPFVHTNDDCEILYENSYGRAYIKTVNSRKHIFNNCAYGSIDFCRKIAKLSGCHSYIDDDATIRADNRFLFICASSNNFVDGYLDFGELKKYHELFTGENGCAEKIKISLDPCNMRFYIFDF